MREECVSQGSRVSATKMKASVHSCFCILAVFARCLSSLSLFFVLSFFKLVFNLFLKKFKQGKVAEQLNDLIQNQMPIHKSFTSCCLALHSSFFSYCFLVLSSLYPLISCTLLICLIFYFCFNFLLMHSTLITHTLCFLTCNPHIHSSK